MLLLLLRCVRTRRRSRLILSGLLLLMLAGVEEKLSPSVTSTDQPALLRPLLGAGRGSTATDEDGPRLALDEMRARTERDGPRRPAGAAGGSAQRPEQEGAQGPRAKLSRQRLLPPPSAAAMARAAQPTDTER